MKRLTLLLTLLIASPFTYADDDSKPILDTIAFQLSNKAWVSTKTALLTVNLNATLTDKDLVKARAEILNNLAKIAAGDWHLLSFDRSQDSSGLEKLTVVAQARVDQAALAEVYQQAKAVSKPGASYAVGGIEFKPSLAELEDVRAALRAKLYDEASKEIARINKVYTGQTYALNMLVFFEGEGVQQPMPVMMNEASSSGMIARAAMPVLTVSNELTMTAMVQAASTRK